MKRWMTFLISFLLLSTPATAFDLFGDNIPPLVIEEDLIQEIILEPIIVHEGNPYSVEVLVADNSGIEKVSLLYKVNNGNWQEVQMKKESLLGRLEDLLNIFNILPVTYGRYTAQIPPQQAGSEVWYKIVATDRRGNSFESIPRYYIVDNPSGKKVLIVDPSYPSWYGKSLLPRVQELLEQIEENYPLKSPVKARIQELLENITLAKEYEGYLFPKHYWNILARDYQLRILTHFNFKQIKSFEPKVVILSNIWLNLWEIPIEDQNRLIRYLREQNGGLIVTHGTLYDMIIYKDPETQTKVGVPEHIGNASLVYSGTKLLQLDSPQRICEIIKSKDETLATILGFKLAPLVEYAKKILADAAYSAGQIKIATVIGSLPLFPAYVPFSGNLEVREEHPLLEGLPSEFKIEISSAYEKDGKNGYTLFGWQFVLPSEIIYKSRERWESIKSESQEFLNKLSEYQERTLGKSPLRYQERALNGALIDSISKLQFGESDFTIEILGNKRTISAPKEVLEKSRILKLAGELGLARAFAVSDDGRAGIVVRDEPYLQCGIRTVYFSFEVEAGEDENSHKLLRNAVEWASSFEYKPVLRNVVILANDIDWELKGKVLAESLERAGFKVTRVYAKDFDKYKSERFIVILGGPKAYDGVGEIVQEVLSEKEQELVIEGKRRIFVKANVWTEPQLVIIIAGKDRHLTAGKIIEYLNSIDIDCYQLFNQLLNIPQIGASGDKSIISNQTTGEVKVIRALIDASHNQYFNEQRLTGLITRIKNELGWLVDVNAQPITLDLLSKYNVLIIPNPKSDITEKEAQAIKEWVRNGGGLLITGNWYKYVYYRSLNKVTEEFGIRFNDDELMDDEYNTGKSYYPLVGEFNFAHPTTRFLSGTHQLYYSGNTLDISGNAIWLIRGYETSYAVSETGDITKEKGSKPIIAAAVEVGSGRIVAYGSSMALSDEQNGEYIRTNWPFIKGVLLWLARKS